MSLECETDGGTNAEIPCTRNDPLRQLLLRPLHTPLPWLVPILLIIAREATGERKRRVG